MATITKINTAKGVKFKARVRRNGQSQISKTFSTKQDAARWAKQFETDLEREHGGLVPASHRFTLAEIIDRYIAERLPQLSPTTQPPYQIALRFWKEELGHFNLAEIEPSKIAAARDKLHADNFSVAYQNRFLAALGAVYTMATKHWFILNANPVSMVARAAENNARRRFLSVAELNRLMDAANKTKSPHLPILIAIAVTTGLRKSEITTLTWRMIDFERGLIVIPTSKNGNGRSVVMVPPVMAALAERKQARAVVSITDDDLVFPSRNDHTKPTKFYTAWVNALELAGIEDFRFHDLRHTTAAHMAGEGASLLEIGQQLGHTTPSATYRYSHLVEGHNHNRMRVLGSKLLGDATDG
jgi:integrase